MVCGTARRYDIAAETLIHGRGSHERQVLGDREATCSSPTVSFTVSRGSLRGQHEVPAEAACKCEVTLPKPVFFFLSCRASSLPAPAWPAIMALWGLRDDGSDEIRTFPLVESRRFALDFFSIFF